MELVPRSMKDVSDLTLLKLAREIAQDIHPIDAILERRKIDSELWQEIQNNPRFQKYLTNEMEAWNSSTNAAERVRLKSLSLIEEWMPEGYERAHDPGENLNHKVELMKLMAKLAGLDRSGVEASVGEKLSVTINLGADSQLKFEKTAAPMIDVTPNE